jgi:hypothetical protein
MRFIHEVKTNAISKRATGSLMPCSVIGTAAKSLTREHDAVLLGAYRNMGLTVCSYTADSGPEELRCCNLRAHLKLVPFRAAAFPVPSLPARSDARWQSKGQSFNRASLA